MDKFRAPIAGVDISALLEVVDHTNGEKVVENSDEEIRERSAAK